MDRQKRVPHTLSCGPSRINATCLSSQIVKCLACELCIPVRRRHDRLAIQTAPPFLGWSPSGNWRRLRHMAMLILSLMLTLLVISSVVGVRLLMDKAHKKPNGRGRKGDQPARSQ